MLGSNKNLIKMIEYPKEGILSKDLIRTQANNISLFCMAKGSFLSEHTSTKEGFVYVIEGKGIFTLKGKKIPMIPGKFIFLSKNVKHSLSAEKNTAFVLSLAEKQ